MTDENVVVNIPVSPEERQRRLMVEVHRLAGLATVDWTYQLQHRAEYFTERFDRSPAEMKALVLACLKDAEKAKAEDRRIEQRAQRDQEKAKREEERKAEKDAGRKAKEKAKALADVAKLPRDERDDRIAELAASCGEDVAEMQRECSAIVESRTPAEWDVEPWGESIAAAALLQELIDKIDKHAIVAPHQALAIALWIMLAWVHEVAADISPYLLITAPDEVCGKTTLGLDVVGKLVPRPFSCGGPTAAVIFRMADEFKPTQLFDNVDTLFKRKPEVTELFNLGWKRGPKVPRMDAHGLMRHFDPFCPKLCTMIGTNIPPALLSKCIVIKMKKKKPTETIAKAVRDDDEFKELRRKLLRWSNDNAAALKDAPLATDFSGNREYDNWHLQLAIAALADTAWRLKALNAAELLTRSTREPSWLEKALTEFGIAFTKSGGRDITGEAIYVQITADVFSDWHGYNRGTGVITRYQFAHLFKPLGIHTTDVGPSSKRVKGWRLQDFTEAFDRYGIPQPPARDPRIRASGGGKKSRGKKSARMRGSRRASR